MKTPKKFKLNKKFKKKWVTALRSGKYEQTTSELFDGHALCCLGVACAVAGVKTTNLNSCTYIDADFASQAKSASDRAALNSLDANHQNFNESIQDKLMTFNDEKRLSFKWIANYIEKHL